MIRPIASVAAKPCQRLRRPTISLEAMIERRRVPGVTSTARSFASLFASETNGEIVTFERTAEQKRSAKLEYDRMRQVSNRILSGGDTDFHEFQLVFNYWTSKQARLGGSAASAPREVHDEYAESLLDLMMNRYSLQEIGDLVKTDDTPCGGLVNASHMFLIPFRGTRRNQLVAEQGKRLWGDATTYYAALCKATKVQQLLNAAIEDEFCDVMKDSFTQATEMTLWMYRTWFLASFPRYVASKEGNDEGDTVDPFDGATTVSDCLHRMQHIYSQSNLKDSSGMNSLHATLISAWIYSELPQGLSEARKVLDTMEMSDSGNDAIKIIPYNSLLNGYAKLAKQTGRADEALEFFEHIRTVSQKDPTIIPEEATYGTVLMALANAGQHVEALQFLKRMLDEAHDLVGTISCNIVLDAYAKHASNPEETEAVFQWMASNGLKMDRIGATAVMEAWGRERTAQDPGERSERILLHCHELAGSSEQYREMEPDDVMYNMVLNAWAIQSERTARQQETSLAAATAAAERADALLRKMLQADTINADIVSYNAVILAWAKSGSGVVAVDHVLSLLEEMKKSDQNTLSPTAFSYNSALQALVDREVPNGVERAMDYLRVMKRDGIQPDVVTWNILLEGCVGRRMVGQAEDLLSTMERNGGVDCPMPNEISYNIVLRGYAKEKNFEAPERAQLMLERMEKAGFPPSRISFCTLLDVHSKSRRPDAVERSLEVLETMKATEHAKPCTIAYNTVLNTLAQSRQPDAPERAEMLLLEMQRQFEATGDRKLQPNAISFSTVMNCWVLSEKEGAAERTEALLGRMEEHGETGRSSAIKPSIFAYATVLNAWSKSPRRDAADKALSLLNRMELSSQENLKPSAICYNSAMNAIAKSRRRPNKAVETRALLDRMIASNTTPMSSSYSTVLNACAYCNPREARESFDIAKRTLLDYLETEQSTKKPSVIVFVNFIICCVHLLPIGPYRNKMATAAFVECDKHGLANEKVVSRFKAAVATPIYRKHMKESDKRKQLRQQQKQQELDQFRDQQHAAQHPSLGTEAKVAYNSQA